MKLSELEKKKQKKSGSKKFAIIFLKKISFILRNRNLGPQD